MTTTAPDPDPAVPHHLTPTPPGAVERLVTLDLGHLSQAQVNNLFLGQMGIALAIWEQCDGPSLMNMLSAATEADPRYKAVELMVRHMDAMHNEWNRLNADE